MSDIQIHIICASVYCFI